MSFRKRAAALLISVLVLGGVAVIASGPPKVSTTECQAAPNLAELPSGATFHGQGCYLVPSGLTVTKPLTIDGGTYEDPTSTLPGTHSGGLPPIVKVIDTHNVTIENVTLTGPNPQGLYNGKLVNQAGIVVLSSTHVSIDNVSTSATHGDGVELTGNYELGHPKHVLPDSDITVDHLTVTHAGRDCFNPIEVYASTFTDVDCISSDKPSIDMESDEHGLGSGNLTFIHLIAPKGVNIIEPVNWYLNFTDSQIGQQFHMLAGAVSIQGTVTCQRAAFPACVSVGGGILDLNATFDYEPGIAKITEAEYRANPPGRITIP